MSDFAILLTIYLFSIVLASVGIHYLLTSGKSGAKKSQARKDTPVLVSIEDMLYGYGREEEEKL